MFWAFAFGGWPGLAVAQAPGAASEEARGPGEAWALELALPPFAELTHSAREAAGTRAIPTGPTVDGFTPNRLARGRITTRTFRIPVGPSEAPVSATARIAPLERQIAAADWEILFACQTDSCGGFDFRFDLEVVPPPEMFVDLGEFHFLAAMAPGGAGGEGAGGSEAGMPAQEGRFVSLIASRSQDAGYLQIVEVAPVGTPEPGAGGQTPVITGQGILTPAPPRLPTPPETAPEDLDLAGRLEREGRVVLEDLVFASGSTTLPDDLYPSLTALAAYLAANPNRQVALVGHTDASGSLAMNIDISRQRAQAAREKLVSRYGTRSDQVAAEGMGYLSPRASNLTEDGRTQNRRVEAILTSTRP